MPGVNYYRLRQRDFDGKEEFSEVVSVAGSTDWQSELRVFPNPARSEVTFHLPAFNGEAAELTLLDYSGKTVWKQTPEEGQHKLTLDLSGSNFVSGIYFVKLSSGSRMLTERLVVSK